MRKLVSLLSLCCLYALSIPAQQNSPFIHVDQFGYLPEASKVAVLSDPQIGFNANDSYTPPPILEIRDFNTNSIVFSVAPAQWKGGAIHEGSGDRGWWLDFSDLQIPGDYYIYDSQNDQQSAPFSISDEVYGNTLKAAARMFYYNRCNSSKEAPFAEAGWTDATNFTNPLQDANCRFIEDPNNPSLEKDLTGGWFDAGDYNKYVTFAYGAVHNLLWAFRENQQAFGDNWNIPESGNGIPDIIDELKWELDWLLKMNNPDGSTHIKMGSASYDENEMYPPSLNTDPRYYGPTCSAASIAVASMFAHAAVVFRRIPALQDYAEILETRAINSWNYVLPQLNSNTLDENCDDGSILSGDADWYAPEQLERAVVAAMHLYELTEDSAYDSYFLEHYQETEPLSAGFWGPYKFALNDALLQYTTLPNSNTIAKTLIKNAFGFDSFNNWNGYYGFNDDDLYRAYMPNWSYHWGSNQSKALYGVLNLLFVTHEMNPSQAEDFRLKAAEQLHYFHGVNPLGLVYLSNMYSLGGEHCINEIYHTWFADGSAWDNALDSPFGPPPGFLAGGANPTFSLNTISPPAGQPAQKSYLDFNDDWPNNSWELSEPAIYYQAAYIRLLANYYEQPIANSSTEVTDLSNAIFLFPNPTTGEINLKTEFSDFEWALFDLQGRNLLQQQATSTPVSIDLSQLPSGTYFIRILDQNSGKTSSRKVIKQ